MSAAESPGLLVVRVRPDGPPLVFILCSAAGVAGGILLGVVFGGLIAVFGGLIALSAGVMLVQFGYPVIASGVCRVPVLVVDDDGIRFPLMGPRMAWADVVSVERILGGRSGSVPMLLVYPADAEAVIRQAQPWVRSAARNYLVRYGTPFAVPDMGIDRSLDDIGAAISQYISLGGSSVR
jgi:hypothetical protein